VPIGAMFDTDQTTDRGTGIRWTFILCNEETAMMDIIYLALLVGFFALSAAIVYGCERLRRPS
jgi:hypothetical protein